MRKILIILATVLMLGGTSAYSMSIVIDVSADGTTGIPGGPPDEDSFTGMFDELGIYAETTSTITGSGTFTNVGDLAITGLLPYDPSRDTESLGISWEVTGRWIDLEGTFSDPVPVYNPITDETTYVVTYNYTSGSMDLKLDGSPDAVFNTKQLGSTDDVPVAFTDGITASSLTLLSGVGHVWFADEELTQPLSGDTVMSWQFAYMLPYFWRNQYMEDLSPIVNVIPELWIEVGVDTNIHQIYIDPDTGQMHSGHDGSAGLEVIPEPASVLLLGTGLLGWAGAGIRRRKNTA